MIINGGLGRINGGASSHDYGDDLLICCMDSHGVFSVNILSHTFRISGGMGLKHVETSNCSVNPDCVLEILLAVSIPKSVGSTPVWVG